MPDEDADGVTQEQDEVEAKVPNEAEVIREVQEKTDNLPFENLDGERVTVTFTAANTLVPLSHNLKRIPAGFFVVRQAVAGTLFHDDQTDTPWTDQKIFLKSDTAGLRVTVFIF